MQQSSTPFNRVAHLIPMSITMFALNLHQKLCHQHSLRAAQGRAGRTVCANSLHTPSMARITYGQHFASACDPTIFSNLIQLVVVFCALRAKSGGGKERRSEREMGRDIYEVRQIFSGTLYQPKVPFCGQSRKKTKERER